MKLIADITIEDARKRSMRHDNPLARGQPLRNLTAEEFITLLRDHLWNRTALAYSLGVTDVAISRKVQRLRAARLRIPPSEPWRATEDCIAAGEAASRKRGSGRAKKTKLEAEKEAHERYVPPPAPPPEPSAWEEALRREAEGTERRLLSKGERDRQNREERKRMREALPPVGERLEVDDEFVFAQDPRLPVWPDNPPAKRAVTPVPPDGTPKEPEDADF